MWFKKQKNNFTKVNCKFDLNIKNILFDPQEYPIIVTDCNEIYQVVENISNQLELQKLNFQINNNEIYLVTMFDSTIYFLLNQMNYLEMVILKS